MSPNKAKQKIDKILELVQERVADEVGGLMGATLIMSDLSTRLISKEDFFDEPSGKLVFSEVELSGEVEGDGCILISIKDAVRLGGTLIMLPENELEEASSSEDYSEEIDDSYGEIANIIAGSYTKIFEEMYPKSFRFIRKKQEIITPVKVDIESDKPIPNQNYYQVSAAMNLNGTAMGNLVLLIPAAPLGLDEVPPKAEVTPEREESPQEGQGVENVEEVSETAGVPDQEAIPPTEQGEEPQEPLTATKDEDNAPPVIDINKQKKRVDACLKECSIRMGDEVGALLGAEVSFSDHSTKVVNKEDFFFDEASGKQILAHMDVVGDRDGKSYLYIGLKDAIFIGGTLIMLPPSELETIVAEEDFNEDCDDAYGEIANIISGVFTKVFEEQYPHKIRFVKTALEKVVPMKVDAESDEPMPDVLYYMVTSKLTIGEKSMGNVQMLTPLSLFQLEQLGQDKIAEEVSTPQKNSSIAGRAEGSEALSGQSRPGVVSGDNAPVNPEFLLVSNDKDESQKILSVLNERGIISRILDYKDNINDFLPGEVKGVFLVMQNVNENGLGVAIKISGVSSIPLIAVGPEWTRTKVITAVKYGVDDILVSPASESDIGEKIDSLVAKIAA